MIDRVREILANPHFDDRTKVRAARETLGQIEKNAEPAVTADSVIDGLETVMLDASRIEGGRPLALLLALVRQGFLDGPDAVIRVLKAVARANRAAGQSASRN